MTELADRLGLNGRGRLLDVGCGPGSVTLLLAHHFEEAIGVDPDHDMLAEADRLATSDCTGNVRWVQARAEELTPELGLLRVATFGQSFHWMDRLLVASIVFDLLEPGGAFVHINENKDYLQPHAVDPPDLSAPPYEAIAELVKRHLGPVRRAGQGSLSAGMPGRAEDVLVEAGFTIDDKFLVQGDGAVLRSTEDVVAWVFSRSDSAPHLFEDNFDNFETELRALLITVSPTGYFEEHLPATEVAIFRRP